MTRIKQLRTDHNLTQQQMSDILGIPKRTIEDWEHERRIPPEYLFNLIEFYLKHH